MDVLERNGVSPERAWVATFLTAVTVVVAGAVVFTERVYYGFLWRYFWGPVAADAEGAECAAYLRDSEEVVFDPEAGCAAVSNAYVAEPGYTTVSTVSYMVVLIFMLGGVYMLLQRFDLRPYADFFLALVPFMLFGGALRVVEDSFVAAQRADVAPAIDFPLSAALISPFIYFTVFFIALGAFLLAKSLSRNDLTETYHRPLAVMGAVTLVGTVGYLVYLAFTADYVGWYPLVTVVTVGLASVFAAGAYLGLERFRPELNEGTGYMGPVVVWGHAIDGVANVIASDWIGAFGIPGQGYSAKHVVNRIIIDVTNAVQPAGVTAAIGDSWPFLVVKLAVAVAIIGIFDERFFEESPRYAVMLLSAILAVGLGPGTRDMIRVSLGI